VLDFIPVILAVSPVIIVFICVLFLRLPADYCGLAGFATALLASLLYFQTDAVVAVKAILAAIVESLPITLLVATSILQVFFMERTGAIRRIAVALKTLTGDDKIAKTIIINIGFAAILWGVGLNPLSILPLLLLGLGFSPYAAVALPAIGSAALFIYAFLGAHLIPFYLYTGGGQPFEQVGGYFIRYIWPTTLITTLGVLYITGGRKAIFKGFSFAILTTAVVYLVSAMDARLGISGWTGILSGVAIIAAIFLRQISSGKKVIDRNTLSEDDKAVEQNSRLSIALLPLILTAFLFLLSSSAPFGVSLSEEFPGAIHIIPLNVTRVEPLAQAYFWTFVATVLCVPFYRGGWRHFKAATGKWAKLGLRPVLSAMLFFATAYLMWHSGKAQIIDKYNCLNWVIPDGHMNMIDVMVNFCKSSFDGAYAVAGTIAGLRMGFISGSETLPIIILTRGHLEAAYALLKSGGAGIFIAAASAVAASLMVMLNPARLQNASAVIGQTGVESRVWRATAVIAIITVAVIAVIAYFLSLL